MTELRTDYKEDILETSQQGKRTFNIVGADGTVLFEGVHIEDTSHYIQVGDEYGQAIINAQNEAINKVSKGSGLVFDTYQDYLDAKARGEVAVGNTIYIKEGNQSEITAEQIVYNNSNVKLALDTHGEKISEIKTDLSEVSDELTNNMILIGTETLSVLQNNSTGAWGTYSTALNVPEGATLAFAIPVKASVTTVERGGGFNNLSIDLSQAKLSVSLINQSVIFTVLYFKTLLSS